MLPYLHFGRYVETLAIYFVCFCLRLYVSVSRRSHCQRTLCEKHYPTDLELGIQPYLQLRILFLLGCNSFSLIRRSRLICSRHHSRSLRQCVCCNTVSLSYRPSGALFVWIFLLSSIPFLSFSLGALWLTLFERPLENRLVMLTWSLRPAITVLIMNTSSAPHNRTFKQDRCPFKPLPTSVSGKRVQLPSGNHVLCSHSFAGWCGFPSGLFTQHAYYLGNSLSLHLTSVHRWFLTAFSFHI